MNHIMLKIVHFEFLGDYSLRIQFEDGKLNDIDFRPILKGPLFGPLKEIELFKGVKIDPESGTIVWPNGADFDPDTLYNWESVSGELAGRVKEC